MRGSSCGNQQSKILMIGNSRVLPSLMTTRCLHRIRPSALLAASLAAGLASSASAGASSLRLLDLAGRRVDPLAEVTAKATVFLFVRADCPISNRYAPEVHRLVREFASRGVVFKLVYVDPTEPSREIRQHLRQYRYHMTALRDNEHALVKMTGAKVTPEVAVFVRGPSGASPSLPRPPETSPDSVGTGPSGCGRRDETLGMVRMVYRGRIDDQYMDFGKARPAPTTHDLEDILQAIVQGKTVAAQTTRAVGCFIQDLQ